MAILKKRKRKKPIILIAEDDKYIAHAFRDGFLRKGFEVINAYNGKEALEIIKKKIPGIILLDLVMPVKNGLEVLEEIKKDEKVKEIPVIVFSNLEEEESIKKAKELGAVEYLLKANFSMEEVIAKIKKYLEK